MECIQKACKNAGIPFIVLESPLYSNYINNFGSKRVSSIPFWSISEDGKKGKMPRQCTLEYKVNLMNQYIRALLGYKYKQHTKKEHIGQFEMHIGFLKEESNRCFTNQHKLFVNKYPLIKMRATRSSCYHYLLQEWHLDAKGSACCMCPFHRNYFFEYIRKNHKKSYDLIVRFDEMLEQNQLNTKIKSKLYISRSRKRIWKLTKEECEDAEYFNYCGSKMWNGF